MFQIVQLKHEGKFSLFQSKWQIVLKVVIAIAPLSAKFKIVAFYFFQKAKKSHEKHHNFLIKTRDFSPLYLSRPPYASYYASPNFVVIAAII